MGERQGRNEGEISRTLEVGGHAALVKGRELLGLHAKNLPGRVLGVSGATVIKSEERRALKVIYPQGTCQ